MRKHLALRLVVLVFTHAPLVAQNLDIGIDHQPVACAVAGKFPRLDARFAPGDAVAAARIVFQPENTVHWYSVAMKAEGAAFTGVLPQPKKELKAFQYYIEVTDKSLGTSRTANYTTTVASTAVACEGKVVASSVASASVLLEAPAGAPTLPIGFASDGVVVAGRAAAAAGSGSGGSAAGAGAAGAGAVGAGVAAAAGGGIGTAAVIGIVAGAAAAAAAGVAVAGARDGDGEDGSDDGDDAWIRVHYSVAFEPSPPGIDVSACAGRALTWSSQSVGADASGNFNETWAPNEPNTMRVAGQVTSTTFQATLTCVNGARSGSISASGSNGTYRGTFEFGASRGQVTITRRP